MAGDDHAEVAGRRSRRQAQIGARARAAVQKAGGLQVAQRAGDRGARDAETLHELSLARQAALGVVLAGEDFLLQRLEYLLVFGKALGASAWSCVSCLGAI